MQASIIVPTHDRPAAIAACLAALQAQTGSAIEIVVVDDGSPVPVAGLPEGPHPVRLIRQPNAGPATARNTGAAAACGDWLLFTDDDCRPRPGWAAAFLAAGRARPGPTMLGGTTINAVERDIFAQTSQEMTDYLTAHPAGGEVFFASNNIALPRAPFLELGGFDTGYPRAAGEDRALCRSWAAAGHAFARAEDAVLDHHHALSLARFWRQHRNYGYGAARFHAGDGAGSFRPAAKLDFYAGLLLAPLKGGVTPARLARAGLIGLAQMATIQGFRDARSGK